MKHCKNCGQQNGDQNQYCSNCGEFLSKEEYSTKAGTVKFCPSCGSKIEGNFCSNCGANVKNTSLDKETMIEDTINKKASKLKKRPNIKFNRKVKICAFASIILVIVALLANWIVQETVINPKKQKACVEWARYREGGMIGFKDGEGNIKLKAQYINAGNYTENGLTKVLGKNHLWGYMDFNGKMVIKPQFEGASYFASNGLARVYMNGKAGFIDESGKYVIEPQFSGGGTLGGFSAFNEATGVYETEIMDDPNFSGAGNFTSNGLACVYDENTQKFGYIDKTGTYVIEPKFICAKDFQEGGFAKVVQDDKSFYINEKGEKIEKPQSHNILSVSHKSDGDTEKYGYKNEYGKYVIDAQFADAHKFQANGLAWVQDAKTEKWGCINQKGEYVIKSIFDEAGDFEGNGLSAICDENEKWGYVNTKGEYVIEPPFAYAGDFADNGLAYVHNENTNESGYINAKGEYIINLCGEHGDKFNAYGLAKVNENEKQFYINAKGEHVADVED